MCKHKNPLYLYIITTLLVFFNGIMFLFPKEIIYGAKNGLLLWYNNVLPCLLPFMIVSYMLTCYGFPYKLGKIAEPFFIKVLNISGEGAFPIIMGIISGCPMGAKTTCDLYKKGFLTKNQAERLVAISNNTGAVFVVAVLGESMLLSGSTGLILLLIEHFAALLVGITWGMLSEKTDCKGRKYTDAFEPDFFKVLTEAVANSLNSVTQVGCYIMLFSVICTLIGAVIGSNGLIYGIFEVTSGVKLLSMDKNLPLIAGVLGWAGFSIHAQSIAFMTDVNLSVKKYIIAKAIIGLIAFIAGFIIYNII